jgi:hypothetical protein
MNVPLQEGIVADRGVSLRRGQPLLRKSGVAAHGVRLHRCVALQLHKSLNISHSVDRASDIRGLILLMSYPGIALS